MEDVMQKRLIVVSNRLPFQLLEKNNSVTLKESDGGLVSALKSYFETSGPQGTFNSKWWIGSADFPEKRWKKYIAQEQTSSFSVEPLFIEKKTYNKFYNGFCNATLWPLFHYFPSFVEFDEETFKSYEEVNRHFADKLLTILQPGDTLWIHDYQLMLLPGMIREQRPDATIGYFLHIPFPSFEVFRMLHRPWKEKIINGLLGADLIGFHTHEYVQHFLKSVQMVTGYDYQFRTVFLKDRIVKADLFPLGIDFDKFHNATRSTEVTTLRNSIRSNFEDKKIIFSVDRLDYTKGITHRLSGFERFLELHPEWRERVVFVLVVVPSRQIISKYNERKKLIEEHIGRVNGKYSTLKWQPIIYRYNHLSFDELSALYQVADVGLITPLRDGMNLVAKEYVASQTTQGVLILSELAGAANEMGEALQVNPMDREEVSHAIHTALIMDASEQQQKIEVLHKRLREYNVIHWVNDFLKQLEETKEHQKAQQTRNITPKLVREVAAQFGRAERRHLFLDYDGTLVPFTKLPKMAVPDSELIQLLKTLSSDARTTLTIISGRDRASLDSWFRELDINLVAEHGAAIRLRNSEWKYEREIDQSWKPIIKPTLDLYMQRSPGSFIEEKNHTLAWHYRNVESELGFIRSRELLDNLHHMVRNSQLQIIDGNKVIEVRVSGVDKGSVAKKFLDEGDYDFIMAIGDDKTDEDMFRALADKAITIKIGSGHTLAQYNLTNQIEVIKLLRALCQETEHVSAL
ncbi:bifunctional alpha,alpha-trehalose-phosphate synthase (UDP-forming)/trehalose-phosphatase [Chryseosolibacter indicus]|uniref:Bifunctional alpha,alpha-trehalose-phosphate synthase (UDP-forming)/trehalose-phosphatase n=1 Tax=Chryseosolibacter indicus TaxID=2782351 RepID=A0ABS5VMK3_9BACT|nr:bifunctional alpha,alpha-trehalose-phosphate synthase (UDP-forming)/trehalose-phosphatase [Chryseosolibacter indicus]MBT1702606.1 bifunctional alpha,alpha-trehalose-phosphate synthase (UDP-forming)/trehalose-phosphatase [Chryseosolibacter indicus]